MHKPLVLLALLIALPLVAQVKESVTVSVVEVPVTVVDRSGNPVRGLTAANFEIVDEGKKRAVTACDAIDFSRPETKKTLAPLNPAATRNFLLLFDLTFSSPTAITRAQKAARDFIAKKTEGRDRVAVGTIDITRGFKLLTAFTTDRTLLTQAIDNPRSFRGNDPLQLAGSTPMQIKELAAVPEAAAPEAGERSSAHTNMGAEADLRANEFARESQKSEDAFNRHKVETQIDMLGDLAKTLHTVGGRKFVVFLSEGFDPRFVQGSSNRSVAEAKADREAVENGQVWKVETDKEYGNAATTSIFRQMAELFRRSDVVLHAIDIQGLRVQNDFTSATAQADVSSGVNKKSNDALILLSTSTGGELFHNSNDLGVDFDRMLHQEEVVYVLAFNAPSADPGKYHNLKVKLVGVPGTARLQARNGYYEAGNETETERSLSVAQIVMNDIPQPDIAVSAVAASFGVDGAMAQVPVILDVSGPDLIKAADDELVVTDIFIYAFDEEGVVRDSLFQRLTLDMSKVGEKMKGAGLKYYGTLSLPPGHYAVRSLVRLPEVGKNGFVRTEVVVPQAKELAVSAPIFLDDASRWVMVKGTSHAGNAQYPFVADGQSFIPGALLGRDPARQFALYVHNATPDQLTVETTPNATPASQTATAEGSALIYQLGAATSTLDVTVRKKGSAEERRVGVKR